MAMKARWFVVVFIIVVSVTYLVSTQHSLSDGRPALEALEPTLTIRGSGTPSVRTKTAFRLKNTGRSIVTIEGVATACPTCRSLLAPADVQGTQIKPGQELPLEVMVAVPEMGKVTQPLFVFHNGPGSPLRLDIVLEGRRRLPILDKVINGYPLFDNLMDTSQTQKISVKTFEEIGSPPWLGQLTTAHPSVKTQRGNVKEEFDQSLEIVRRTYEYTVAWNDVPDQREVRSRLYASSEIDPKPGVFIGTVSALIKQSCFSPTIVHLQKGGIEKEWVIFDASQDAFESWSISEDLPLPDWLAAEWKEMDARRTLQLSLTTAYDGTNTARCKIQLIKNGEKTDQLEVMAFPSL